MYRATKTLFDYLFAVLLLPFLLPLMFVLCTVSVFVFRGKIFFTQPRMGRDGVPFTIYKLRSMNDLYHSDGTLLADQQRMNSWGKFLRRSSLDELPQLVNVLKGDVSFIGPRPLPIKYKEYLSRTENYRHTVKPGITGLAQIKGRNRLNWEDRFRKDLEYISKRSLSMDLQILAATMVQLAIMAPEVPSLDLITYKNSIFAGH